MKRALKRMKIQQFFKKNKTAQNFYDKGMGVIDAGYDIGMGQLAAAGAGMYTTGKGIYSGMGEYMPASNDLISKSSMGIVPEFGATDDDSIIVRRREYISEIYGPDFVTGSTTTVLPFVLQSFPINPGLERTFPWLSQIAQNYDEYELLQCIFTFKSTTTESSNSENGQVGTVIMVTNYNAAAPNFQDKATMQRYMGAVSNRLTESTLHGVECDPAKLSGSTGEYIRTNPVVIGQDVKTYDHGKFQIAIANASAVYANVSIGELWVSYTVKIRKSKFFTALGFGITKDIFLSSQGETVLNPFGPAPGQSQLVAVVPTNLLRGQQNNLGCRLQTITDASGTLGRVLITFPGTYSGYLKVLFTQEGSNMVQNQNGALNDWLNDPTCRTGNVTLVTDIYGSGQVGDTPSSIAYACSVATCILLLHIKVDIATNGTDNSILLPRTLLVSSSGLTQAYVDISEFNAIGSGKNQGVNDSDEPIWINNSGFVVNPV